MCDIYAFFQGYYTGSDICDEDYRALIDYCFTHAAALSFCYHSKELAENEMGRFHPFISRSILPEGYDGTHGIIWLQHQCFFYCTEELRAYLHQKATSLFDWFYCGRDPVPEDLCFYRKDGTMLFSSCTHEGECYFVLRKNEPIPEFVDHYGWARLEEDHLYYTGLQIESTTPFFSLD